jgi:hypothetical protein
MAYSNEELKACAERELRLRERVYPRWIEGGRLSQRKADAEIAMMRQIVGVLEERCAGGRLL